MLNDDYWLDAWGCDSADWHYIQSRLTAKRLVPGEILWPVGSCPDQLVLVRSGLLKAVFPKEDGREYIKEFFWQGDAFFHYYCHLSQAPSPYVLTALEPTALYLLPLACLSQAGSGFPAYERIYLELLKTQLRFKEEKEALLLTLSPGERYRDFRARFPHLLGRVAEHQIAAYLGITPISLSRIKRRINKG
ncbi:Crp/Fnr family transcriptional regulator [Zobellella aerophila]|uniref:Crp/Fnr family transcriptional regulator n=1 Tax=Zobellella aerophila TaxID=870480 RepID=A0ABP6WAU3_9GAMM